MKHWLLRKPLSTWGIGGKIRYRLPISSNWSAEIAEAISAEKVRIGLSSSCRCRIRFISKSIISTIIIPLTSYPKSRILWLSVEGQGKIPGAGKENTGAELAFKSTATVVVQGLSSPSSPKNLGDEIQEYFPHSPPPPLLLLLLHQWCLFELPFPTALTQTSWRPRAPRTSLENGINGSDESSYVREIDDNCKA